jgi:hypothetical protein
MTARSKNGNGGHVAPTTTGRVVGYARVSTEASRSTVSWPRSNNTARR